MDAVEFLNIIDQISKKGTPEEKMFYNASREAGKNYMAVAYAERWSKEHPRKTRQSEFLTHYPDTELYANSGSLQICPRYVYGKVEIDCTATDCYDCQKKFWLEEVE